MAAKPRHGTAGSDVEKSGVSRPRDVLFTPCPQEAHDDTLDTAQDEPARPVRTWRTLPCLLYSLPPMELFDPARHLPETPPQHSGPSAAAAPLPLAIAARACADKLLVPRVEDCHALWDRYDMLDNIRAHSDKVAQMAHAMALRGIESGLEVSPEAVEAAGLLHDLGKTYTIRNGGNHAQLGGAWVMRETGNGPIAQAVMHHVFWPWAEGYDSDALFIVMAIIYADKRVKHDAWVTLEERFEDLIDRYGVNEYVKGRIAVSYEQGKQLEAALSSRLGVNLHECIADSGRLVQRT